LEHDLFIGLMSGTSLDGVDGVLADFSAGPPRVLTHASVDMPAELRAHLLALNTSGPDELHRAALAANALTRLYATTVHRLLAQSGLPAQAIKAIGAHGQTVRHRPQSFDGTGYTLPLNQPALLAAGGQGAPLAPLFHRAWLGEWPRTVGVLNIGGISNLSLLRPGGALQGFDCGPGNALLDGWCLRHLGRNYDDRGAWAASGQVRDDLLASLLAEPYFSLAPPKSTGRDLFHSDWLARHLTAGHSPVDVQATLAELTARSCAQEVQRHEPALGELVVCGGGAFNEHLMGRLAALLPGARVCSSTERGLPPLQVEAAAFAWLASKTLAGEKLSLESTTGARGARALGCIYPA
jgi:anhydro-N-acetylmuramic acid kinase